MPTPKTKARSPRRIAIPLLLLAAIVLVGVALLISRRPGDPFKAAAIAEPAFPSLTYGIQAFLWWDEGEAGKYLDLARLMSFSHVKQTFAWRDLEPAPGQWDWQQSDRILAAAAERDLRVIARLGKAPAWSSPPAARRQPDQSAHDTPPASLESFANYCRAIAERYRGLIAAYQIWNEPNLAREWGNQTPDAEAYVDLLAACSAAIRAADPGVILISAGLSPTGNFDDSAVPDDIFLDHMYRHGFQRHIDVVGVHAPGFAPPEIGPDDDDAKQRWFTFRRVEDLRKIMLLHADEARQMAIMEFGYTTDSRNPIYAWFGVSEAQQADYLQRAYEYAIANWRPWIGLMTLIYLPNPAWGPEDEEYWWAILDPISGRPRPAYIQLANMRKVCGARIIPARPADGPVATGKRPAPLCP